VENAKTFRSNLKSQQLRSCRYLFARKRDHRHYLDIPFAFLLVFALRLPGNRLVR
jgi:hypothetical protein